MSCIRLPGVPDAKSTAIGKNWYAPDFTLSKEQQHVISEHIVVKTATEVQYIERTVFMKSVDAKN